MVVDPEPAFTGRHLANVRLTGPGSEKVTRHHTVAIERGTAAYLPGDAIRAHPRNDPALVDAVIRVVGATGDEPVRPLHGSPLPLRRALSETFDLGTPARRLLELCASRGAADLASLLDHAHAERLRRYLHAWNAPHDVLDVLTGHPAVQLTPAELTGALRPLLPRLYSIASSLRAHPGEVHLLVVSVRYTVRGRERLGVGSTWLAERWPVGAVAEFQVQSQQKHFGMPADSDTPMIMVGPGTGLAPFRAFIEERRALGASGRNWLFFGEQHRASDYLFESELTGYARDGLLRLDVAFSRDQVDKVYVQHRMREQARDIWDWLQAGAELFVCGNKDRMAVDVDRELHRIAETVGGRTPDSAREYVEDLRRLKRYKRDVY